MASFEGICRRAQSAGMAVRGAFYPEPGEFERQLPGMPAATIVLLGFTGSEQWQYFHRSVEASDGAPHALDRWSRRIIGALAAELGAAAVYPQDENYQLPFQQLGLRSEAVHQSPIGLLIHPTWGLWHAYRGALVLARRIEIPDIEPSAHPCEGCAAKPCLSTCPVSAFRPGSFDVQACTAHLHSEAGAACRDGGCLARRSCPVGPGFRYHEAQMRFHLRAFMDSATTAVRSR